ncbi:MAG: DUF1622 domain-containing protein [Burkholderiales bacterium]
MDALKEVFAVTGALVEVVGVVVILAGFAVAVFASLPALWRGGFLSTYRDLRVGLGRALVLGLEFLIAGDIIRTVTVTQTLESAGVLAVIVLIRVLLALTLEWEIGERPSWRRSAPFT